MFTDYSVGKIDKYGLKCVMCRAMMHVFFLLICETSLKSVSSVLTLKVDDSVPWLCVIRDVC